MRTARDQSAATVESEDSSELPRGATERQRGPRTGQRRGGGRPRGGGRRKTGRLGCCDRETFSPCPNRHIGSDVSMNTHVWAGLTP
jgi:hypothetical protein